MPTLTSEEAKSVKAAVFDLNENAAKQALYGMIEILTEHPSVLTKVFSLMVDDARKYTNFSRRIPAP